MDEILKLPLQERPSLCWADLSKTALSGADLSKAALSRADLRDAELKGADLRAADLKGADLRGADLTDADLRGADLFLADLRWADLHRAKLQEANFTDANLGKAYLIDANLSRADFTRVALDQTIFEPMAQSLNSTVGFESARDLSRLRFVSTPSALVSLREQFAKAGLRDPERQVNFAKLRSQQDSEWHGDSYRDRIEAAFSYLAFDLTCRYGLDYGRPLRALGPMILLFGFVYTFALRGRAHGAIWRVWQPDRIWKDQGQSDPERLSWEPANVPGGSPRGMFFRLWRALGLGLLFSLLSAFQIGWRELNVGNWITRLMPREYTLRATGWVRVVSGVQSLLSVYLLALWALTYFGRPFE